MRSSYDNHREAQMKYFLTISLLLAVGIFLCLLSSPTHAYPVSPFNARALLDAADIVCYGKVVAVGGRQGEPKNLSSAPLVAPDSVATVKVISLVKGNLLKGKAPASIRVVFRESDAARMEAYTELARDESAILFLKSHDGVYRFVDDRNGKLGVPRHKPLAYKSASPTKRMAAELITASQLDRGLIRLACIEQLGSFALPEVVSHLGKLTSTPDMTVQGIALASLIRLDSPPQVTRLAAFFRRQGDTKSLVRFGTTGYGNGHLKARVLTDMENRFNVICRDFDAESSGQEYVAGEKAAQAAAQRWKTFDLIGFLKVAIENIPPEKGDSRTGVVSYRSMADMIANQIDTQGRPAYLKHTYRKGSRSLAIRLLKSTNLEVSESAARAIDLMISQSHTFPYPQGDRQATMRYVRTVRDWAQKHPRWVRGDR
jgi:hypothetical protein